MSHSRLHTHSLTHIYTHAYRPPTLSHPKITLINFSASPLSVAKCVATTLCASKNPVAFQDDSFNLASGAWVAAKSLRHREARRAVTRREEAWRKWCGIFGQAPLHLTALQSETDSRSSSSCLLRLFHSA